jgi:hypothetical protein
MHLVAIEVEEEAGQSLVVGKREAQPAAGAEGSGSGGSEADASYFAGGQRCGALDGGKLEAAVSCNGKGTGDGPAVAAPGLVRSRRRREQADQRQKRNGPVMP